MSYNAKYQGNILIKNGDIKDKIKNIMSSCFDNGYIADNSRYTITFEGDGKYKDDEFFAMYAKLSPYIIKADIAFEGEDGALWKHSYRNGAWREWQGVVGYQNPHALSFAKEPVNSVEKIENLVYTINIPFRDIINFAISDKKMSFKDILLDELSYNSEIFVNKMVDTFDIPQLEAYYNIDVKDWKNILSVNDDYKIIEVLNENFAEAADVSLDIDVAIDMNKLNEIAMEYESGDIER